MRKNGLGSYNVAAISMDGSTISTQLWNVRYADAVVRVREWLREGRIQAESPVVVSCHEGGHVSTTAYELVGC